MDRETAPEYLSYLLRVWKNDDSTGWHASLEAPQSENRRHFSTLRALIRYLERETGAIILHAQDGSKGTPRADDLKPFSESEKGA